MDIAFKRYDRPLSEIYAVDYAATREGYRAQTGVAAGPFDHNRQLKKWWDARAANPLGPRQYLYRVVATDDLGQPILAADGTVELRLALYDRSDAVAVNYAPPGTSDQLPSEEPVPLDPDKLGPNERLVLNQAGTIVIRDMQLYAQASRGPGGLTPEQDAALFEILAWVRRTSEV